VSVARCAAQPAARRVRHDARADLRAAERERSCGVVWEDVPRLGADGLQHHRSDLGLRGERGVTQEINR